MIKSIQYTSDVEFSFYLQNFCQLKSDQTAIQNGDVVSFQSGSQFIHAAMAINSSEILEKDSLNGLSTASDITDPQPGHYVVRNLRESLYGEKKSEELFGEKYQRKIYSCRPEKAAAVLKSQTQPAIVQQLKLRLAIGNVLNLSTDELRNRKTHSDILPLIKQLNLKSIMQSGLGSSVLNHYFAGLIRSNMYQIYLLACGKSIEQIGECYNPEMRRVLDEQSRVYNEIYAFEAKFNIP
ncbi:hypothetical protein [Bdellovibrio sp. HCB2-146]|uniref:hypothetical protein n=1 Tax=Bdellovibrio sp. HCB2-146 TaxID=3394362 RepID=UPI0039BD57BC